MNLVELNKFPLQLSTSRYNEFICCEPCLQEFEAVVTYRETLLCNQRTLDEWYRNPPADLGTNSDDLVVEESVEHEPVKMEENFIDAEAMLSCNNCSEELDESSFDHHVCSVKVEALEENLDELETSFEVDTLDDAEKKRKYPKKKLKDPITCPKCSRQFFYKAYFQFHYKDVHREDREEICQYCGKVFKNSRRLNSHILIHQTDIEKKFKCDKCDRQFNFSGDLTRHRRVS